MQMPDDWVETLGRWSTENENVRELWLFGSRATGHSRDGKWDVDLAIALMPADGDRDWAYKNFLSENGKWARQLESIVGRDVSLEILRAGTREDAHVRSTGVLLWTRASAPPDSDNEVCSACHEQFAPYVDRRT
jgi:hypothetical protein